MGGRFHYLAVKSHFLLHFGSQLAQHRARSDHFLKNPLRISQLLNQLHIPVFRLWAHHLSGSGFGVLRGRHAGKHVMEIIRHQQHNLRLCKLLRLPHLQGHQLINRVEDCFLDAGAGIQIPLGNNLVYLFVHPLRASVPVSHRIADALTVPVQQHEVHAPGVHAYADGNLAQLRAFLHAQLNLCKQLVHIPAVLAVLLHHPVGKTVHLFQHHLTVLQMCQDVASAGCSDVNRKIIRVHLPSPSFIS